MRVEWQPKAVSSGWNMLGFAPGYSVTAGEQAFVQGGVVGD